MITKENYEIWMMDYLDGNLSDSDQTMLLQFLEDNPTLKEELNGLDNMVLNPTEDTFTIKDQLLKTQADEIGLGYPDYIAIKEVEEGLSEEENLWKASYLKEDKQHSNLFTSYTQTLLKANKNIRYQLKGNLKRATLIPIITINKLKRISIAAAVAMLLSVGTLPFLKESAHQMKTVVVNDPPSLITMPKAQTEKAPNKDIQVKDKINTKAAVRQETVVQTIVPTEQRTIVASNDMPIEALGIESFETTKVNAYELGLNEMMPIIIANNMAEREQEYLAMQSQVEQESARLSKSSRAIVGSVKVINFLSGNETKMNKVLNQDGQMVAYQLESENISIRQRIKNKPVTN